VVQTEALGEQYKLSTPGEVKFREVWKYCEWLHAVGREELISVMRVSSIFHNLWFEDSSDVFRNQRDQVYLDYTHLTSKGALLVTERLGVRRERKQQNPRHPAAQLWPMRRRVPATQGSHLHA
jgi:hypothetical protein